MNAIFEVAVLTAPIQDEPGRTSGTEDQALRSLPADARESANASEVESRTATGAGRPESDDLTPHDRSQVTSRYPFAVAWPFAQQATPPAPGVVLEEFDSLYQTYARRVYRQCYRMLGNREDAEDLTQEVFLQLFRKAGTFRGESSFSTWLHRLTINTVLMQMRRHRRWRGAITSLDAPVSAEEGASDVTAALNSLPASVPNPLDTLSLDLAITKLASGYKEVFLLHDLEGYRHDEIARLLGISEGTSKSQLHKARLRLREMVAA